MKGAGINPEEIPVTGQDSTVAGLQRILVGQQYMTIFKPIVPEAEIAAEMAISLGENGEVKTKEPTEEINNGKADVPSVLLTSTPVTKDNIKSTVIAEEFVTAGGTVRRRLRLGLQRSGNLGLSMSPGQPLLQLEGISKQFGPVHALDRVDFAVNAGEVVGLVGDNGAGKSTLVKSIAGIHTRRQRRRSASKARRSRSRDRRTRPTSGSRPSTRTSRSATTSTSSPTSSSAARRSRRARGRSRASSTR